MDDMPLAEVMPMSSKSWHASTLGARPLAPETLMMGYGYDPHLSERSLKPPLFLTSPFSNWLTVCARSVPMKSPD
jgi:hypothetical protein